MQQAGSKLSHSYSPNMQSGMGLSKLYIPLLHTWTCFRCPLIFPGPKAPVCLNT